MKEQDKSELRATLSKLVADYHMPAAARKLLQSADPLILCGITAAGKDTLAHELVREGGYEHVVSHTTRSPRLNHGEMEKNGEDYHFVSEAQILKLVQDAAFVEIKRVHNNFYGTSMSALAQPAEHGRRPVLEIDVQGVDEFLQAVPLLQPVFLLPPNFVVWQERLKGRGVIDAADKINRFKSALKEIATARQNSAYQLLINEDKVHSARLIHQGRLGRQPEALRVADELTEATRAWLSANQAS